MSTVFSRIGIRAEKSRNYRGGCAISHVVPRGAKSIPSHGRGRRHSAPGLERASGKLCLHAGSSAPWDQGTLGPLPPPSEYGGLCETNSLPVVCSVVCVLATVSGSRRIKRARSRNSHTRTRRPRGRALQPRHALRCAASDRSAALPVCATSLCSVPVKRRRQERASKLRGKNEKGKATRCSSCDIHQIDQAAKKGPHRAGLPTRSVCPSNPPSCAPSLSTVLRRRPGLSREGGGLPG